MVRTIFSFLVGLFGATTPAYALDAACTTTANLAINYCPENSTDWYQSYTDIVNNLDALAKTTRSSFTVTGAGGLGVTYGITAGSATFTSSVGFGTASPIQPIDVVGTSLFEGTGLFRVVADRANASRGIDISPAIFSGTSYIRGYGNVTGLLQIQAQNTGDSAVRAQIDLDPSNGYIIFKTTATGVVGNTLVEAARIDSAGRFGVGSTSPATKFQLSSGTFTVDGNVAPNISLKDAIRLGSFTTAQVQGKTPGAAGELIFNSDIANVCVSTGTTIQGYKLIGSASTTCQ